MSIWGSIGDFVSRVGTSATSGVAAMVEAVRTAFAGDPQLRRQVAFSIAMIALSAKMAKADGVVTQDEIRAFHQIFSIPPSEARNVARLYDLAKSDVAGFEVYASRMAGMCGSGTSDCAMLEDILDGLFHIAKADGVLHEQEGSYLRRVAEIFEISDEHYRAIRARHVQDGDVDPYAVLGIERARGFEAVRKQYRRLAADNHPDRLIARGLPPEFIVIANARMAAINGAYETIERMQPVS